MHLGIDYLATTLLILGLIPFFFLKTLFSSYSRPPSLGFSTLKFFNLPSKRSALAPYPLYLHYFALLCLMLAFIDPHLLIPQNTSTNLSKQQPLPTEGIAIYLVLDQSGSMAQPVQITNADGSVEILPKIDLLKRVTKQFILDHPSDLIGLISFARIPQVLVPLTLDRDTLLNALDHLQVVSKKDEDGTAIGYAIFKAGNLMTVTRHFSEDLRKEGSPPYTIKSGVIMVVTDGFQDPSRLDRGNRLRTMELDDAAAYAKQEKERLYVINIDPTFNTPDYAPHRRQLEKITDSTGGKFYLVGDHKQSLQGIYQSIDHLEKGTILQTIQTKNTKSSSKESRFSLYPFFIFLGLCSLFAALFLDYFILKEVP